MSDLIISPKNYGPSSKISDYDSGLKPFQVLDMGKGRVLINFGDIIGPGPSFKKYTFDGPCQPQKVLSEKIDESKFLTVAKDDFICLVFSGESAKIEKKNKAQSSDPNLFKLAEIKDSKEDVLNINQLWTGDISIGGKGSCAGFANLKMSESEPTICKIEGGVLIAGDKNFHIEPRDFTLIAHSTVAYLLYLSVKVKVNQDDDKEILLPGVETCTSTSTNVWSSIPWTSGTNYPDNVNPVKGTGLGTIIVPLGKLNVVDGVPNFENAGCGNITITHCGGTLGFTRF